MKQLFVAGLVACVGCGTSDADGRKTDKVRKTDSSEQVLSATMPTPSAPIKDDFLDPVQFKVGRQDTFRIQEATENLIQLTAAEERKYLQQNVKHSMYMPYHFYSIQENTSARKVITLLSYDGEYKTDLLRLVYNAQNKLTGRQVVAYSATDGEMRNEAWGWFESPTSFRLVEVKEEPMEEAEGRTEYVMDSLVTRYTVQNEQFSVLQKKNYQRRRWASSSSEQRN